MLNRLLFLFSFCLFLIFNTYSQNNSQRLDSLQNLLSQYQKIDSNSLDVVRTLSLLENETRISDPNLCLEYGKLAIKILELRGDSNNISPHLNIVGNVYLTQKKYYTAMQYYFKGYKNMVEIGKEDSTGYYLIDIGNCFFADNNNELPIKYYRKSAQVFIKTKGDYGAAVAFNNIGLVKSKIGELDSALYYFNLGLSFRQKLNDNFLLAHSYRYIGDIYQKKKEYEKALHYLNQAFTIFQNEEKNSYDQRLFFGQIYQSYAQVYFSMRNFEKAIDYYKLSLQVFNDSMNDKFSQTSILQKIASCYLNIKQYSQALSYANQALGIAEYLNSWDEKRNCHYILVQIYAKMTNAQKVFTHLELYSRTTDSLINQQTDEEFSRLRIEVEAYQIKKELAYQNISNANIMAKMKHRAMVRNLLFLGLILVIFLVIALYIAYIRKHKMNKILYEKNKQISQQKEELEITSKFKQQFLANMSHEIRTPMTGIIGMIDFLKKTKLDEKQKEYIEIIKNSSEVLLMLINDILDLSKIEAGKMELRPIVFSIKSLVKKTQLLFDSLVNKKDLKIRFNFLSDLPENIEVDEMRLMEVISNLISNAVKYTEKGTITVNFDLVSIKGNNLKIRIEVIDTGIGVDKEDQKYLFEIFSQLDSTSTLKYKGTGLGLSISKKYVELMGGEINMESDGKNGSKFWFTFNAKSIIADPVDETPVKEKKDLSRSLNLTVLLVEDKIVNQKVIELMLNYFGCKIKIASNGAEALDLVRSTRYDIIFMDIQMPVMDGITAVKELRKQFEKLPPIIALSANVFEGFMEKYLEDGFDDCLPKPVKSEDMAQMIRKWCSL